MSRKEFEEFIIQSPQYTRLIFCYGPQLFICDDNEYRNLAIQIAYEVWCALEYKQVATCIEQLNNELRDSL